MSEPRVLRLYQTEAVDAVWDTWSDPTPCNPVVVLPTGTGKSTVIATLAARARTNGYRVVLLAHRRELLDQMAASVMAVEPDGEHVGIVQADRDDPSTAIVAASFQTLQNEVRRESLGPRQVVLVDECFVAGTRVDGVPIQNVRPGDMVTAVSPSGDVTTRRVAHVMRSTPSALVKVSLSSGESFVCTPGHPFLTPGGWTPAGKLSRGVRLHHAQASREPTTMHSVRETVGHGKEDPTGHVEQQEKSVLLEPVSGSVRTEVTFRDNVADQPSVCPGTDAGEQPHAPRIGTEESVRVAQTDGISPGGAWWERNWVSRTATSVIRSAWVAYRGDSRPTRRSAPTPLQRGHCTPESETVRGNRRREPQFCKAPRTGPTPGPSFSRVWVDNVTVLKPGSDGRYGGLCPDGYVYNLEVDTDHTYTVGSGVTVHNCHHSTAETYMAVLASFGVTDRLAMACGFTATATRADGGLGKVWDSVVYEKSLKWAIQQGYLITPRGLTVVLDNLDLSKVTVRAGDYAPGELSDAMEASVETTVDAILTHAVDRRMIVFAAGVEHANALAVALTQRGIMAADVTGAHGTEYREGAYTAYRNGSLQALVTVQVLTEGADFPMCDCVVMARPTRSQTLYTQMVGRAVRLWEGKQDALVLDLAGTMRDLSLVTLTDLTPEAETKRVSPVSDEDPGQEEPKPPKPQRIGPAKLEDFDILSVSPANWLQTKGGVLFLDVGQSCYLFLWPPVTEGFSTPDDDDAFQVGVIHRPGRYGDGWLNEGQSLPLPEARDMAETHAPRYGQLPDRGASWRSKSKPSDAQVRLASSLGIMEVDRKNRARLSDDISTAKASRTLDAHLPPSDRGPA